MEDVILFDGCVLAKCLSPERLAQGIIMAS